MNKLIVNSVVFILIVCPNYSCKRENYFIFNELNSGISSFKYIVKSDTISITSPDTFKTIGFYEKVKPYNEFCLAYNKIYHKIDLFNLNSFKFIKAIQLEYDGPNAIQNVHDIAVIDLNKIIIQGRDFIYFINDIGKVIKKINIFNTNSNLVGSNFDQYRLESKEVNTRLIYSPELDMLITHIYDIRFGFCDLKHYEFPLFSKLNINKNKIELIHVTYPEVYRNNYYGFHTNPSLTLIDTKLYFNFPISNEIYRVDLYSNEKDLIKVKSMNLPSSIPSLEWKSCNDANQMLKHFTGNSYYGPICYDQFRKLLYRFEYKYISGGKYLQYITVLNLKLETVFTYEVKNLYLVFSAYIINKDGLFLPFISGDDSNLKFIRYQVSQIN